jgi:hypothetical protein
VATKPDRGSSWEFVVKRKELPAKPLYLTFATEAEGDQYVRKLEVLLDRGVVPEEFRRRQGEFITIEHAVREYLGVLDVPHSEKKYLAIVVDRIGITRLDRINDEWVAAWVREMKRERNLAPSTIRHYGLKTEPDVQPTRSFRRDSRDDATRTPIRRHPSPTGTGVSRAAREARQS